MTVAKLKLRRFKDHMSQSQNRKRRPYGGRRPKPPKPPKK